LCSENKNISNFLSVIFDGCPLRRLQKSLPRKDLRSGQPSKEIRTECRQPEAGRAKDQNSSSENDLCGWLIETTPFSHSNDATQADGRRRETIELCIREQEREGTTKRGRAGQGRAGH
jgi:hypothetical protein